MHVAVQERADVFVSRRNVVLFQNAENDSRIGHARDLAVVQILINPDALLESPLALLYAGSTRVAQRVNDIEQEKASLRFCHTKVTKPERRMTKECRTSNDEIFR